jgi:hypothetical protein
MTDFEDYGSRHLSFEACEQLAGRVRSFLGCDNLEPLPHISEVLSRFDIVPMPRSHGFMGDALASARLQTKDIDVREDLVDEILKDTRVARFTLLHELAHLIDHGKLDASKLFRKASGNQRLRFLGDDESVEGQADDIADALAMPVDMVLKCGNAKELSELARMPLQRAFTRFNRVRSRFARKISQTASKQLSELRAQSAQTPAQKRALEHEAKRLRLWLNLPSLDREDPSQVRLCEGFRIHWGEFGRTTMCGWFIENDKIVSFFASRAGS